MTVDEFREAVMALRPNDFMGLNGAGQGILGSVSSGSEAVEQLQHSAIEFARMAKRRATDEELTDARRDVTGKVMVAATVGAISETQADRLVAALHDIMKERK